MPSVERSARFCAFTRLMYSTLSEKNHAHFIAARPKDLLAALNVMLLLTTALFGSVANGVYLFPLLTKSQWISSASTTTRLRRQISPSRIRSPDDHVLPVGFCGLHRMNAFVSMLMRRSKSSKSIWNLPSTYFIRLSSGFVPVKRRSP